MLMIIEGMFIDYIGSYVSNYAWSYYTLSDIPHVIDIELVMMTFVYNYIGMVMVIFILAKSEEVIVMILIPYKAGGDYYNDTYTRQGQRILWWYDDTWKGWGMIIWYAYERIYRFESGSPSIWNDVLLHLYTFILYHVQYWCNEILRCQL